MVDPIDLGISSGTAVDILCNAWHSNPLRARRLALRIAPPVRHFFNGFSVYGFSHLRFRRVFRHLRSPRR